MLPSLHDEKKGKFIFSSNRKNVRTYTYFVFCEATFNQKLFSFEHSKLYLTFGLKVGSIVDSHRDLTFVKRLP